MTRYIRGHASQAAWPGLAVYRGRKFNFLSGKSCSRQADTPPSFNHMGPWELVTTFSSQGLCTV
jgi:hypothetical protein